MPRLVFVQRQVSQLDEPVYAKIHQLDPLACAVVYWNDYGYRRRNIDPELGIIPDLSDSFEANYQKFWIDSREHRLDAVVSLLRSLAPRIVVVSDLPLRDRLYLARKMRACGSRIAFRTDKNCLSERAYTGSALAAERRVARFTYDILAPASPLTRAYYAWPKDKPCLPFPYTTNEDKFTCSSEERLRHRREIRERLGIGENVHLFLSATKFMERENPWSLIRSFEKVAAARADAFLVALGDGPQLAGIKAHVAAHRPHRIVFPGFVPFSRLQDYFFAADSFLHFAGVEPWGVSPQDALFAGLGLVTSDRVGAAQVFLQGELRRFLIRFDDDEAAAERMIELCDERDVAGLFAPARAKTQEYTAMACAHRWVTASL